MHRLFVLLTAAVALIFDVRAGIAANPEHIEISAGDARLKAVLFRPEGNGPFPAVVGLHNCTGLMNRAGVMGTRYSDWAERLSRNGFAVLLPDSNRSRGLGSQCGARSRPVRVDRELVADANAARLWLQRQPWVAADRISLLGWSSGANAALWAVRTRIPVTEGPDFRSAVAFYPGCRRLGVSAWSARVPTLILIGRADEMT
jgi:dienelactone hydrolase